MICNADASLQMAFTVISIRLQSDSAYAIETLRHDSSLIHSRYAQNSKSRGPYAKNTPLADILPDLMLSWTHNEADTFLECSR